MFVLRAPVVRHYRSPQQEEIEDGVRAAPDQQDDSDFPVDESTAPEVEIESFLTNRGSSEDWARKS